MAPGASTTFLLAAGLVFLLVLAIGVAGVVSPRSRRQLRFLARQSSIGPAVDGEAVVVDGAVETPFTGEWALCYEARVMERDDRGSRHAPDVDVEAEDRGVSSNWSLEYVTAESVPFGVADASGTVPVVPDGATLDLDETAEVLVTVEDDLPERVGAFVEADMVEVGFGGDDRRYVEAALRPGKAVTVVGPAVDASSADLADDAPVDAGTTAVVGARAGDCIVGAGDLNDLRSSLREWGVRSAAGGLSLTALGYVGMLAGSGAV
jgi:hypothetical protein